LIIELLKSVGIWSVLQFLYGVHEGLILDIRISIIPHDVLLFMNGS